MIPGPAIYRNHLIEEQIIAMTAVPRFECVWSNGEEVWQRRKFEIGMTPDGFWHVECWLDGGDYGSECEFSAQDSNLLEAFKAIRRKFDALSKLEKYGRRPTRRAAS